MKVNKEEEFLILEKEVKNLVNIYLPKIEYLYRCGNGSNIIHKAGNYVFIIYGYMEKYKDKDIDTKIKYLSGCKIIIEKAEEWMKSIGESL